MTREIVEAIRPVEAAGRISIDEARRVAATINGKVIHIDTNTAIRFRVLEEAINLAALRAEAETLKALLAEPEDTDAILLKRTRAEKAIVRQQAEMRLTQIAEEIG